MGIKLLQKIYKTEIHLAQKKLTITIILLVKGVKAYSLSKRSFHINKIHRKIKRLVSTKKKIEIPSNPNEKLKFISSDPNE